MADDTPQDTTTTQDTPVDQPVVQSETPKVEEEQQVETPPTETPKEEPTPTEEPKTETPAEVPETPEPPKEEPKQEEQKPAEETKPVEETKAEPEKTETPKQEEKPKDVSAEVSTKVGEIKPAPETPSLDEALAKSGPNIDELRAKANRERQDRKQEHLSEVEKLAKSKQINNDDVRELLHVSQSTATNYLEELTKQGKLKKSGKAKGTTYSS